MKLPEGGGFALQDKARQRQTSDRLHRSIAVTDQQMLIQEDDSKPLTSRKSSRFNATAGLGKFFARNGNDKVISYDTTSSLFEGKYEPKRS